MSDLSLLYQEMIMDHGKAPRNFGALTRHTHSKEGYNPLCGDRLTLYVEEEQGLIKNLGFVGCGCAISMASASLMTETLKGKSIAQAEKIFAHFHRLATTQEQSAELEIILGKLMAFTNIGEFPMRVKCATLAWHTLTAALNDDPAPVSTEKNHE